MNDAEMLALVSELMADAQALKRAGRKDTVKEAAKEAVDNAEERARSAKVMARIEEAEKAERDKLVPMALQGQRGKGLRARSLESREENRAFREHVRNEGVKQGEDSERETKRYTAADARKLEETRKREEGAEISDEALMRRIDSLAAKSAKAASQ